MLRNNKFGFTGEGSSYFGILISNVLLMMVTLLIYLPWAMVKERKFFMNNTTFSGKPFSYTGSGGDLLKGFLIAFAAIIVVSLLNQVHVSLYAIGMLAIYLVGLPYLINELLKYDAKHSHWNGKTFEYNADTMDFVKVAATNIGLTIITVGIYAAWARVAMTKYVMQNLKLGKLTFDFEADGTKLFIIMLKGMLLTMVTFGIYGFWFIKDLNTYITNNMVVNQDGKKCNFNSNIQVGDVFSMLFVGGLIVMFTFGIGMAWVVVRNTKIMLATIDIADELDPENI